MNISLNSINIKTSLVDGPGIRGVLFLQGCDFKCEGCHNAKTWDINAGKMYDVLELVNILEKNIPNKKITISGGEPLLQKESLLYLLENIKDWDICLYTGYSFDEVPKSILYYLKYIKVGKYNKKLKTTTVPFIGSINQYFIYLKD